MSSPAPQAARFATAGPLAGLLFDATGSYQLAFSLQAGSLVLAALLIGFLRIPTREPATVGARALGAAAPAAQPEGTA